MVAQAKPRVTIYIDGAAEPDPGAGGWAVILIHDASGKVKELAGGEEQTTSRRMELTAAIKAFEALKQPCVVQFNTSAEFQAVQELLGKKIKKKQADADLIQALAELVATHEVNWTVRQDGDKFTRQVRRLSGAGMPQHAPEPEVYEQPAPKQRPKVSDVISKRQDSEPGDRPRSLRPVDAEFYLLATSQNNQGIWAVSMRVPGEEEQLELEHEEAVTANQAQIMAAIQACYMIPEGIKNIRIFSTSEFLVNGASKWMKSWKQRGWTKKDGEPVSDQELWQELDDQMQGYRIDWQGIDDDPALELLFEDIGRRAQEMYEEQFGSPASDDWFAAE